MNKFYLPITDGVLANASAHTYSNEEWN